MKIYFAGAIRGGRQDEEIYARIVALLKNYGTLLTEHVGKRKLLEDSGAGESVIYGCNFERLREADVLVAEVSTPSLGVGYEVATAEALGKPILCLYREGSDFRLSAMIAGNPKLAIGKYVKLSEVENLVQNFFENTSSVA
jgi:hypothetical protein